MQVKNELDPVTKGKIVKGSLIALSGGVAVALTAWLCGVETAKALLLAFVSVFVPSAANAVREYKSGQ